MNLLPIETWRALMGFHPWHFWQLADTTLTPITRSCSDLVHQYTWQNTDAGSRADVIEAIANAEARLAQLLGYYPAPHWGEQTLEYPKYFDHQVWRMSASDADGHWLTVRLKDEGYVQALGVESLTLLGSPALTFSDNDGDGLRETWTTAAVATTETDTDRIAVYYAAADRLDSTLANWQIAPVQITIAGGNVVVTGKAWQVVDPIRYEGVASNGIDPTAAANFVTNLAVYVRKNDPDGNTNTTSQSTLIWETLPYPGWATCCGCTSGVPTPSTDPAAEAYAIARAGIRDAATGLVNFGRAAYNATTGIWEAVSWGMCRPPDRVTIRYRAGYPLALGAMDRKFQLAVARLAAAELARPICACDTANRELYRWQFDLSRSGGAADESYAYTSPEQLNNPLGMRRGHVYAWQFVQNYRNLIGFSM